MTTAEKNLERKLRRALYKAGYTLHKARGRLHADNFGGYMIVDYMINGVVAGSKFELDLDDVKQFVLECCAV